MLPALLKVFDGVNAQHGLPAQHHGLVNHGFAAGDAFSTGSFKWRVSDVHRGFPHGLDVGEGFFAQVSAVLPLFNKAVQAADVHFPVGAACIGCAPSGDFINQHLALGFDRFGLLFHRV